MSDPVPGGGESRDFTDFKGDIDAAERRIAREIDPGARALVIAILVFVLLATLLLPHAGPARGLDVLVGSDVASEVAISLPSRVFAWIALVFGVGFSITALVTRRWALAWIALAGSTVGSFLGVLAIWSRQTAPGDHPGPGIGLIVAWIAIMALTYHWARVVAARTMLQLATEEHRRRLAAEGQSKTLLDTVATVTDGGPSQR